MSNPPQLDDFIPDNLTISNPARKLHHVFDEQDCYALWAAYSAGRPLLVRGKPGTGKSQMARAIAEQLGWAFVSEVIRGSTELSELHWHFDAIGRLGEAQTRGATSSVDNNSGDNKKETPNLDRLNPLNFLSPGAFWWGYDWHSAAMQYDACVTHLRPPPEKPDTHNKAGIDWNSETGGVVLLLDELDKAEPDLPNGLLETLGQYRFTVTYINHKDNRTQIENPITANPARLLVVITTNEERELPTAFVRRCFVHTLKMEESPELVDDVEKRHSWLIARGKLHFGSCIDEDVYEQAARLLWQDRTEHSYTRYPPGLAEYIDLLNALEGIHDHMVQRSRLNSIARFALKKEVD